MKFNVGTFIFGKTLFFPYPFFPEVEVKRQLDGVLGVVALGAELDQDRHGQTRRISIKKNKWKYKKNPYKKKINNRLAIWA